jgi:hypothetical protein
MNRPIFRYSDTSRPDRGPKSEQAESHGARILGLALLKRTIQGEEAQLSFIYLAIFL